MKDTNPHLELGYGCVQTYVLDDSCFSCVLVCLNMILFRDLAYRHILHYSFPPLLFYCSNKIKIIITIGYNCLQPRLLLHNYSPCTMSSHSNGESDTAEVTDESSMGSENLQ